jgi:hypothetical protein
MVILMLDVRMVELLAELLADKLETRRLERSRWVSAEAVAAHLGVERDYVYAHAGELGVRRLGEGPRSRLRFRLDLVDEALCPTGRESTKPKNGVAKRKRRRRRASEMGTGVPLLPVRAAAGGE